MNNNDDERLLSKRSHKNATVRAEAAKLLAAIVVKLGSAKSLSGAKDVTEKILPAAAHFIQDGSLDARWNFKTCLKFIKLKILARARSP